MKLSPIPNFAFVSLEEANALHKWKATLQIPNNSLISSWIPLPLNSSVSVPCTSWFGIVCNADGSIKNLNISASGLKANNFSGVIPPEIGTMLYNLEIFYLNGNNLSGSIPREIGQLTSLYKLQLSDNFLQGELPPTLGNLTKLVHLYQYNNKLLGEILSSLGDLTSLNVIYLDHNQLSGPIPIEVGN
ncbi:unnamed protein product [Lactuca saligna]|uniref:Leucine-rich repeat-containing N-terminal plant-type domain-containing protein n=1 Tax=Lactuca saligna TaxID=75948 RepID=A0AA35YLM7_LACSI|nr:unnamed protein product [Lactuca saligna]